MQNNDLLSTLAQAANKRCLSDLHRLPPQQLADIAAKMELSLYTPEQWSYALSYIYGQKVPLSADSDLIAVIRGLTTF